MVHPTPATTEEVETASLDVLVPRPMGTARRLVLGAAVVVIAASVAVGHLGGWFVPRPTDGASFGSDAAVQVDRGRGLVGARVLLPNFSRRTVRVIDVSLEAPGARLISVTAVSAASRANAGTHGPDSETEAGTEDRAPEGRLLPVAIRPGEQVYLTLWLRPESCAHVEAPWGIATATIDFGEGALPPVRRRVVLRQDPIWEGGLARASSGGHVDQVGGGPLAVACKALR
jgi:hypothetical protein